MTAKDHMYKITTVHTGDLHNSQKSRTGNPPTPNFYDLRNKFKVTAYLTQLILNSIFRVKFILVLKIPERKDWCAVLQFNLCFHTLNSNIHYIAGDDFIYSV